MAGSYCGACHFFYRIFIHKKQRGFGQKVELKKKAGGLFGIFIKMM